MTLSTRTTALLGQGGDLERHLEGFAVRDAQLQMAEAIERVLEQGGECVIEAGTGVGKTFAYLVPALLSEQRIVISTGSRSLQEQLYWRDVPQLMQAMGRTRRIALLKGRANYLCLHRMELLLDDVTLRQQYRSALQAVQTWLPQTQSGDIAEVDGLGERDAVWPLLTATTDSCLGQACPCFDRCYAIQARRKAAEAEVVIINHHLLLADIALQRDGFGELVPRADGYIIDEAHQLPDLAGRFLGDTLSSRQLDGLVRDSRLEQQREAPDCADFAPCAEALLQRVEALRRQLPAGQQRMAWAQIQHCQATLETIQMALDALVEVLQQQLAERGEGLQHCAERGVQLQQRLKRLLDGTSIAQGEKAVRWCEQYNRQFALHLTPLNVADDFNQYRQRNGSSWVMTSATLSIQGRFEHFCQRLGLDSSTTLALDSPFDYLNRGLIYLPSGLPDPSAPDYNRVLLTCIRPVLDCSQGRAFVLFTSHAALRELAHQLAGQSLPWPLLVQGDAPRTQLLERFRQLGNAVLLGTASFWEGVDVRGEALSCVIIAKLPFASPADPVVQARIDTLREQGLEPFMHYQLPQAVLTLKQGAGRLIRDPHDRGVLVLCDPRLRSRRYGRLFLDSLPPMPHVTSLDQVMRFFAEDSQ